MQSVLPGTVVASWGVRLLQCTVTTGCGLGYNISESGLLFHIRGVKGGFHRKHKERERSRKAVQAGCEVGVERGRWSVC